jgi:hypothetical protein
MKYRMRIYYTEGQKALMWDRWQAGDSLVQWRHSGPCDLNEEYLFCWLTSEGRQDSSLSIAFLRKRRS